MGKGCIHNLILRQCVVVSSRPLRLAIESKALMSAAAHRDVGGSMVVSCCDNRHMEMGKDA
jgi:hypothetical protein